MALAKLIDGRIKYAGGKILIIDDQVIVNPREEDWLEAGYKHIVGEWLEEKEGYYQVAEYTEEDDKIVVTYHYEEIPDEQETITQETGFNAG